MLTFVGIPALIVLVIAGLSLAGSVRRNKRYRPGRPFEFAPVWFLSSPTKLNPDGARALTAGEQRRQLTAAGADAQEAGAEGEAPQGAASPLGATGGASDRW